MASPKSIAEKTAVEAESTTYGVGEVTSLKAGSQSLHRKLRSKEVQLFAIGGAIGTCELFYVFQEFIIMMIF